MKNQKFLVRFLCVFLAVLMILSVIMMVIPVRAVSENDIALLKARRVELEKQLADQDELIRTLTENRALIIDRKAALDKCIELNRENIDLMNEQIDAYETLIEEKAREYADAVEAENTQSDLFRKRVRAMEEGGSYSYIAFLFAAESVSDFLSRLGDIDDIMHYDRQLEDDLRESRARVDQLKKEYVRIQEEQSAVRDELTGKKELLDGQIEAACRLIESLEENTDDARAEYDAIEKAEAEAYAAEQQAIRQYAAEQYALQLAARAAQQQAAGGTGTYAGASGAFSGSFIWPVDSTYVSSGYGGRSAPTAGASTYHQAIDISAAAGSPIYAAADGTVTIATYNNGLGNYVSIAHDGSTSTRYSHMTNYIVQPGQYVTQGQIIGYVGATGIATGNHLDFAVTSNGQQVDPLQYYDTSALYLGY